MKQAAVAILAIILFGCTDASPKPPQATPRVVQESQTQSQSAPSDAMVRVVVYDETSAKPLDSKAEIWLRGHGSWWIKPDTQHGAAAKNLARHEIGKQDTIAIYPDARDGVEILVPFMMTSAMNPNGSDRDSIIITIKDHSVEIVGLPIEAATGDTTKTFKR